MLLSCFFKTNPVDMFLFTFHYYLTVLSSAIRIDVLTSVAPFKNLCANYVWSRTQKFSLKMVMTKSYVDLLNSIYVMVHRRILLMPNDLFRSSLSAVWTKYGLPQKQFGKSMPKQRTIHSALGLNLGQKNLAIALALTQVYLNTYLSETKIAVRSQEK